MKNFKIVTKLSLAFGIIIAMVIVLGVSAVISLEKVNEAMVDVNQNGLPSVRHALAANTNASDIRLCEMLHISAPGPEEMTDAEKDIAASTADFNKHMEEFRKLLSSPEEKKTYEEYMAKWHEYTKVQQKVLQLSRENKDKEAKELALTAGGKAFKVADAILEKIVEMNVKAADDSEKAGKETYRASRILIIALLAGALVIGISFAVVIARNITGPLNKMRDMLQDIAQGEGDLTKRLDDSNKDELGEVSRWFNLFVEKLRGIIATVSNNTLQVATAANQLQSSAEQIATGAEEVAAQAGTVATASEEMSATSSEIAQNCMQAAEGSSAAGNAAANGEQVVDNTVQVMGRISDRVQNTARTIASLGERSDQIGQIIGTIEDIADQTNLLALNAAIEAARAGEQGRGFAVVADEVRALAERTTKATREIGEMIKAIQMETKGAVVAMEEGVNEVRKGTEEAAKSGEALQAILERINSVTMQINMVATAAEEQTATTAEISTNIHQITDVIGATAKGAQESAAAATQLAATAEDLRRIVGQFKL